MMNLVEDQLNCLDLIELLPDGVCIHQNGRIVFINKNGAKGLGYEEPNEMLGLSLLNFVHPAYHEDIQRRIKKVLTENTTVPFIEEKVIDKNGEIIDVEISATPCTFSGKPAVLTVTRDMRMQKKAQQLIMEKDERHCKYFENSILPTFVANASGRYINVNELACRLLGYSKEELLKLSIPDITSQDDIEGCKVAFDKLKQSGKSRTIRNLVKKDGTPIEIEVNSFKTFDDEYVAFYYDVTERKKAEKVLRENEYRYKLIAESMLDVITLTDQDGKIQYASPSYQHLLGYKPIDMLGKSFCDFIYPDDIIKFKSETDFTVKGKFTGKVECRFKNANSSYIWLEIMANVLIDSDGQVQGGVFCSRDIGERKFSEKLLIDSEERYRQLVELLPDGILVISKEKLVFVNKAAKKILGVEKERALLGRDYRKIVHADYVEAFLENILKIEQGEFISSIVGRYIRDDGEAIDIEINGAPYKYEGEKAVIIVFRNITERIKAEESLEETRKNLFEREKLALIGQMSAGMAHEIRNPLTAVRGYAQLLKMKEYDKNKITSYVDVIIDEIDRVNNLISEFLQLARPKEPNLKKQAITKLLDEFLQLFIPQALFNNVEVSYEIENDLPECLFDKNQIKQVLLNLGQNAIDAMPDGGKLKIVSGYCLIENKIHISLEDNGCGISQARLRKLGTPFFSNKEKGTGLGLSVSYAIIRAHGGKVNVESVEGEGTKFTILLPLERN